MTPSPASGGGGAGDDARTYAYRQVATAGEHNRSTDELIAAARQEGEIQRGRLGLDAVLTPPHPPTKTPSPASGGGGAGDDARTYAYRQVATAGEHNRSTDKLIAAARQEEEIERWRLGLDAVLTPPHPPTKTSSPASGGGGAG